MISGIKAKRILAAFFAILFIFKFSLCLAEQVGGICIDQANADECQETETNSDSPDSDQCHHCTISCSFTFATNVTLSIHSGDKALSWEFLHQRVPLGPVEEIDHPPQLA